MAVNAPPTRRPALTRLDEELLARLLQQAQTPQESYIRESALGVPWGSLANSLVGGMLVGRERNRARNLQEQQDKAAVALLTQAQEYSDPLPTTFQAGKYTDPQGNFVENLAPVEQGAPSETREEFMARMLRNEEIADEKALFNQYVADNPYKASYTRMLPQEVTPKAGYSGTTLKEARPDPSSAVLPDGYTGEDLQPIERPVVEREQIMPAQTVEGITIEGSKEEPSWWDRNIRGHVPEAKVKNQVELALLAGYDPLEFMNFAQKQQTQGYRVLSIGDAEAIGIKNAANIIGDHSFLQQDLTDGKVYRVSATGNKTEVKVDVNTGEGKIDYEGFIGDKGYEELGKSIYKALEERSNTLPELRNQAISSDMLIDMMNNSDFQTGKLAEVRGLFIGYAESLGLLPDNEFGNKLRQELVDMESIGAGYNKIVLSVIKTLGRNPTDLDLKYMIKTMPSLDKLPESNLMILRQAQAVNRANIEMIEWEEKYQIDYYMETGKVITQNPETLGDWKKAKREKAAQIEAELQEELQLYQNRYREIEGITEESPKERVRETEWKVINGQKVLVFKDK
jgi:hypothetical protein